MFSFYLGDIGSIISGQGALSSNMGNRLLSALDAKRLFGIWLPVMFNCSVFNFFLIGTMFRILCQNGMMYSSHTDGTLWMIWWCRRCSSRSAILPWCRKEINKFRLFIFCENGVLTIC